MKKSKKNKSKLYIWIEKKSKNAIIHYFFYIIIPLIISLGATYYIGSSIATVVQRKVSHENALESEKEKAKTIKEENEKNVQNLFTDESLSYINSKFGEPIYSYYTDKILNNFYVVNDNVIKCIYDDNRLVSYAVFANKKKKSRIKYKVDIYMNKKWRQMQLSEFSYLDLVNNSSLSYRTEYAFAGDTDAYRYYLEIYEGAEVDTNGEFYFIGNYMDVDLNVLDEEYMNYLHANNLYVPTDKGEFYYKNNRDKLKPNVYGRIKRGYQDKVHIIDGFKDVNNRNVIESIFSEYVTYEDK